MYVRTLFKIARILRLSQQAIADTLHISHTQVSLWARGRRPVPRRYWEPLITLMDSAIARQEDAETRGEAAPGSPVRALTDADFRELLLDWLTEVRETSRHGPSAELYDDIQQLCLTYGAMDRETFIATIQSKDEIRQRLYEMFTAGRQRIDQLDRAFAVEQRAAQAFAKHLQTSREGAVAPQAASESPPQS